MTAAPPPNFDMVLSKIVDRFLQKMDEKNKMIRLPLSVNIQEAKEIINLLEKLRA